MRGPSLTVLLASLVCIFAPSSAYDTMTTLDGAVGAAPGPTAAPGVACQGSNSACGPSYNGLPCCIGKCIADTNNYHQVHLQDHRVVVIALGLAMVQVQDQG